MCSSDLLVSAHLPGLAEAVGEIELRVDESSVDGLSPADAAVRERMRVFVRGARPVVRGLCLLEEVTGLLAGLDWRPLANATTAGIAVGLGNRPLPLTVGSPS